MTTKLSLILALAILTTLTLQASTVRIVQTNAAGDNIHLIDPVTNKVVAEITGIEVNHGAAAAPDGSRFYFSNEADHTLDVVDGRSLAVTRKIPLSGRPNNVAISSNGRRPRSFSANSTSSRQSTSPGEAVDETATSAALNASASESRDTGSAS